MRINLFFRDTTRVVFVLKFFHKKVVFYPEKLGQKVDAVKAIQRKADKYQTEYTEEFSGQGGRLQEFFPYHIGKNTIANENNQGHEHKNQAKQDIFQTVAGCLGRDELRQESHEKYGEFGVEQIEADAPLDIGGIGIGVPRRVQVDAACRTEHPDSHINQINAADYQYH